MHIAGLLVALVGFTGAIQAVDDSPFRPRVSRQLSRRQFQQRPGGNQGAVKPPGTIVVPPQKGNGQNGGNKGQNGGNKGQNGGNNQIGGGNGQEQQSLTLSRNSLQRTPNGLKNADAGTDEALHMYDQDEDRVATILTYLTVMGEVPAPEKMATVVFSQPRLCGNISPKDGMKISAVYRNINLGTFTNPQNTYNGNPQRLDGNGVVIGHSHVTCHLMENDELQGAAPIAAAAYLQDRERAKANNNGAPQKTCFKGFNGEGQKAGGGLTRIDLDLECGTNLAQGCWTCSTMTGASTHQAAIMGNADRPAQDAGIDNGINGGGNRGSNNKGGSNSGFNGGIIGGSNRGTA
ncbi:hypothetical protein MHUMG1_08736 [Metarhizium humberi]|uniref:Ribosomal protein s17 n=1 Tax=Metarhizium humberi TaxID=2596975 RepID=A0A9P8S4W0_9HYPO|nr:hypothetical protein MHUMG1_08736 [Metarhizium humberi]